MTTPSPLTIVGIGASAGGLKALQAFFGAMPPKTGIAFVVIQHLSPDYKSMMTELLAKSTRIPVLAAEDNMVMKADHIYLITPRNNISTMKGRLYLSEQEERSHINLPVDIFFRSLAEDRKERAVGIILSGTGSDGTRGLRAIKAEGGTVFVQDEVSAEFDGMPRCAIATGLADYILPPEKMPDQLLKFLNHPRITLAEEPLEFIQKEEDHFAKLFAILKTHTKVDFTSYKPATIIRRVERRIGLALVPGIREYLGYLETNPEEVHCLFKDLLIGVTKFFRDKDSFRALQQKAIPSLVKEAGQHQPPQLRIWDVGCSTGEEAYTVAMLIRDSLDASGLEVDVKLFATDIDQDAIEFAGAGVYPESIAADMEVRYLARYFDKIPGGYRVKKSIRQMVIFAAHNVINDPPFTKIDLLLCRNLLIYMQPVLQKKIFNTVNYILRTGGYLFLGNSESLAGVEESFEDIDSKHRLYRHRQMGGVPVPPILDRAVGQSGTRLIHRSVHSSRSGLWGADRNSGFERFYHKLLDRVADTVFLVTENKELYLSFGQTEKLLTVPKGRSSLDIFSMLSNDLSLLIASAMQKVKKEGTEAVYRNVWVRTEEKKLRMDLEVDLFYGHKESGEPLYLVKFTETAETVPPEERWLPSEPDRLAKERIEDLEREVQFTRENLQATIEELQTTNEELMAANEELQSTNEELQSVNEELNTVNAEYQNKVLELTELNTDMNNLMTCSDIPTIFLDKDLYIRKFTPAMTREVNLLEQDVGRPLTDLSSPLFRSLKRSITRLLKTGLPQSRTLSQGKEWFLQRLMPFISERNTIDGVVITLMNITDQKQAELAWEAQHNLLLSILEQSPAAIVMATREGKISFANRQAEAIFGIEKSRLLRMKIYSDKFRITDIDGRPIAREDQPLAQVLASETPVENYIMCMESREGRLVVNINANPTFSARKQVDGAVYSIARIAYE